MTQTRTKLTTGKTIDDYLSQFPDVADYGFADTEDGAISVTLDPDASLSDAAELREIGEIFGYRTVISGEFENGATEWRFEVQG